MRVSTTKMSIILDVVVNLSLWSAIKLRIAGWQKIQEAIGSVKITENIIEETTEEAEEESTVRH